MEIIEAAALCKALGDPHRLQIVTLLRGGEMCACRLLGEFGISQPTLSHHIKILSDCGLVLTRRDGRWSHYSLNSARLADLCGFLCSRGEE